LKRAGVGFASASFAIEQLACATRTASSESEALLVDDREHPDPAPMGYDRLPLEWYQAAARRLKDRAEERNVDAILLSSDHNIVYFTGCFRRSGERSTWVVFPTDEADTVYWYSPGIDRDLIQSWWSTENEYYFCYPHAQGGYPNRGELERGNRVDLWEWLLNHLNARGMGDKTIGVDQPLSVAQIETASRVLPNATFKDIGDLCLGMRIVKSKEEIALTQRAYRYFDKVHAFSRDYVLERGTDATDFEIGQALEAYGINLLMADIERDGKPHSAVGCYVTSEYVRTGVATAYPHPNQFFHARVRPGDNLYVNTDIRLGGMGGEGYRNYQIAPWDSHQEKMWEVVAESVRIQVEQTAPGKTCSEVAYAIHKHQVDSGMQDYIYHRPAHGAGQNYEGHQAPFISLGDDTVIEEGMMFSVEPGLYDAERGIGVNPSDMLLVTSNGSVLMSRVPFSREWSFLTL
jgi:Xaa-Pro aminopeptidase